MTLICNKTFKRFKFETAIDWQINIGIGFGRSWSRDETYYLWIDLLCFNIRIAILKQ